MTSQEAGKFPVTYADLIRSEELQKMGSALDSIRSQISRMPNIEIEFEDESVSVGDALGGIADTLRGVSAGVDLSVGRARAREDLARDEEAVAREQEGRAREEEARARKEEADARKEEADARKEEAHAKEEEKSIRKVRTFVVYVCAVLVVVAAFFIVLARLAATELSNEQFQLVFRSPEGLVSFVYVPVEGGADTIWDEDFRKDYERYIESVEGVAKRNPPLDTENPWRNDYFLLEWVASAVGHRQLARVKMHLLGEEAANAELEEWQEEEEEWRVEALGRARGIREREDLWSLLPPNRQRRLLTLQSQVLPEENDEQIGEIIRILREIRRIQAKAAGPTSSDVVGTNNLAYYLHENTANEENPTARLTELKEAVILAREALDGSLNLPERFPPSIVAAIWDTYDQATKKLLELGRNQDFPPEFTAENANEIELGVEQVRALMNEHEIPISDKGENSEV